MPIFITQARFRKEATKEKTTERQDRAEAVAGLITQVGGNLIANYLTSGEYDVLCIFEAPLSQDVVPALIAATAGSDVAEFTTVMAQISSDTKSALAKTEPISPSGRAADVRAASSAEATTQAPDSDPPPEGEAVNETQEDAKGAAVILDAQQQAVDDIKAGCPAPYYLALPLTPVPTQTTRSPLSRSNSNDVAKK